MADLISRSALVDDLRALRETLGSVFYKMVVDRCIERVEALPGVDVYVERSCRTCKRFSRLPWEVPCDACISVPWHPSWEGPDEEV